MVEIVNLDAYRPRQMLKIMGESNSKDLFMIEEGLDMLAAYRSIPNKEARLALLTLARSLGALPNRALK